VKRFIIPALLVGLVSTGSVNAQNYEAVLAKVKAKYQKVSDIKAHLDLQLCSSATGTCTMYKGEVEMKRPNKLRFDIAKPSKQQVICDGSAVWSWLLSETKVTKSNPQSASQMLVLLHPLDKLLTGKLTEGSTSEDGDYSMAVEVAGLKDIFKTIKITVNKKSLAIIGMEAEDVNGNTAHGSFSKMALNPALKDSRFKFIAPKNAEIKAEQ
jgi:outer membrane lipoprotein-sorting protein